MREAADWLKEKKKIRARPISTSAPLSRSRLGTRTAARLKWPNYPAGGPDLDKTLPKSWLLTRLLGR